MMNKILILVAIIVLIGTIAFGYLYFLHRDLLREYLGFSDVEEMKILLTSEQLTLTMPVMHAVLINDNKNLRITMSSDLIFPDIRNLNFAQDRRDKINDLIFSGLNEFVVKAPEKIISDSQIISARLEKEVKQYYKGENFKFKLKIKQIDLRNNQS